MPRSAPRSTAAWCGYWPISWKRQKSGVGRFIADQVKSWDIDVLIGRIELTVGRDLQYIRFNGALIGGLAGLALHALEQGLKLSL